MGRRQTVQELRLYSDPSTPFGEWTSSMDLAEDIKQVDDHLSGRPSAYLWDSPWFEFDAPEWLSGRLGAAPGWWQPWAQCQTPGPRGGG